MHIVVTRTAAYAMPWLPLFAAAFPGARIVDVAREY